MSGELILKKDSARQRLLALAVTVAGTVAVMLPMARLMEKRGQSGLMLQVSFALLVPLLIWVLYQQVAEGFSGKKDSHETLKWTLTEDTLTLGERTIPLKSIQMVHCWQKDGSWTVNIETTGKNVLLRSLTRGEEKERSIQRLYDLVDALGYRARWRE